MIRRTLVLIGRGLQLPGARFRDARGCNAFQAICRTYYFIGGGWSQCFALVRATAELTALGTTVQLTAELRDQDGRVVSGVTVT